MIHVYVDDMRPCPAGFVLARSMEECLLLLMESDVHVLSLDHDLGWNEPNGTDLVKQMVVRHLYAKEIYLHSSDPLARQQMYQILYMHKPDDVKLFNHPVPIQTLEWIRKVKSS